jgi:hypothetical protein
MGPAALPGERFRERPIRGDFPRSLAGRRSPDEGRTSAPPICCCLRLVPLKSVAPARLEHVRKVELQLRVELVVCDPSAGAER